MVWKITHATTCEGFRTRGRFEDFGTEAAANQTFNNCVSGCVLDSVPDPAVTALRAQHELRKFERRERLAAMCLQGLLADTEFTEPPKEAATKAINYADALIAELGNPFP